MTLRSDYEERYKSFLVPVSERLTSLLTEYLRDTERIDRVTTRPKSIERFLDKASAEEDGEKKYSDPLNQIQDQLGARIVVFYLCDVEKVSAIIEKYFHPIETREYIPDSEWEFGYFGKHYILLFPSDIVADFDGAIEYPKFFELQVKTLFQHAWSETNHDIGYKQLAGDLNPDQLRKLAFTSAQSWGADTVINDLFLEVAARS